MIGFSAGFVVGVIAALVGMVVVMRARMIEVLPSPLDFDTTVERLEKAVSTADGWHTPGTRDLNKMMKKRGITFEPRVKLVEMCKAPYASEVLRDDRRMATLMPCAVAVYEDDRGRVFLSKMNTGLMGRFFGGTVGRVMGRGVAREEENILGVLHRPAQKKEAVAETA